MKYVALKVCNFDRPYSPGERVDASVIDASIVQNAVAQGFIRADAETEQLKARPESVPPKKGRKAEE